MKKNFIKIFVAIALSAVCVLCVTACSDPGSATGGASGSATGGASYVTDEFDIYLNINGIDGESKDNKHDRWIDVITFSHGSEQSVQTGSPDATGRGIFDPFTFKHKVDKATPKIQEQCMKGGKIKSAELHVTKSIAGQKEVVYKVKLEDCKIVSALVESETDANGKVQLVETVKILANKITWTVTSVGLDNTLGGNTEAVFDQTKKT